MVATQQPVSENEAGEGSGFEESKALELARDGIAQGNAIAVVGYHVGAPNQPTLRAMAETLMLEARRFNAIDEGGLATLRRLLPTDVSAVLARLERAYGRRRFRARVADNFRRRRGPDGRFFSPAQDRLMRLPFAGYISISPDPGLLEARMTQANPGDHLGFSVGHSADSFVDWQDGSAFERSLPPLLYAHGISADPATVRTTHDDLEQLYTQGPLRRLLYALWRERPLVFVGCAADEPLMAMLAELDDQPPQIQHPLFFAASEDRFEAPAAEQLGLETAKFDPSVEGALASLIEAMGSLQEPSEEPSAAEPQAPPSDLKGRLSHRTTEDQLFTGREDAMARLAQLSNDPTVHVIGIEGQSGLGKTALVGNWVKRRGGPTHRDYQGVFYWSFNEDSSATRFFASVLRFLNKDLEVPPHENERASDAVADILSEVPLLLIMDGVDALQEGARGSVSSGAIMNGDVRDLLRRLVERNAGLCLTIGQYPITDLAGHLGAGFRNLALTPLSEREGAILLKQCGVEGTPDALKQAVDRLHGHPLALRLLGRIAGVPQRSGKKEDVTRVFQSAQVRDEDGLEGKMRALLRYFEKTLPSDDADTVSLVALFSTAMPTDLLLDLMRELRLYNTSPGGGKGEMLAGHLQRLAKKGLLIEKPGGKGYSAHPMLRENFRLRTMRHAKSIARCLGASRSADELKNVETARPILEAIAILCDAGEYEHAYALFDRRLANGDLFLTWHAPKAGLDCVLNFVGDGRRRFGCSRALGQSANAMLLRRAAAFALSCGETELGAEFNDLYVDLCEKSDKPVMLANALVAKGVEALEFLTTEEAASLARRAYIAAEKTTAPMTGINSQALLGEANFFAGRVADALPPLADAADAYDRLSRSLDLADSRLGFVWLAILVSFRDYDRALDLINTLEPAIQKSNRSAGLPAIRAEKADCGGDPEERVKAYTTYAEHMREGDHVLGQMPALIGLSRAHRDNGDDQAALEAAQEAVDLAGPRGFIRRYGEGLIERGRLRLNNGEASKALDDAELAEAQANTCGNVWVRLGAVRLQSDILKHGDYGRDVRQIQQKLNELKNTLTVPEDMRGTIEMVWWRKT